MSWLIQTVACTFEQNEVQKTRQFRSLATLPEVPDKVQQQVLSALAQFFHKWDGQSQLLRLSINLTQTDAQQNLPLLS